MARSNQWYLEHARLLHGEKDADELGLAASEDEPLPLSVWPVSQPLVAYIPTVVEDSSCHRCIGRRPGHEDVKVYFDGDSDGSGRHRGRVACARHYCRR